MFDSLDDQMARDEARETTKKEKMIKYAVVALTSVLLFGGLYFGVRLLD